MYSNTLSSIARLSDQQLVARVKHLAGRERETTALLIAHLAELDQRRLYLAEGCRSLFIYCTEVLQLSEHAAYGRMTAARAAREFPVILDQLAAGSINLTTVVLLAPHLTPENHRALLDGTRHKTKEDVKRVLADLRPQPSVPATMRRLPNRTQALMTQATTTPADVTTGFRLQPSTGVPGAALAGLLDPPPTAPPPTASPAPPARPAPSVPAVGRPAAVTPLGGQRYRAEFTMTEETHEKLLRLRDLLRHQIPDGNMTQIMDWALTAALEKIEKQKLAATDRPRKNPSCPTRGAAAVSRRVPAGVKRAVWRRDGGQCAFVGGNGRRCTERAFLEFHHVIPYAAGGEATVENIQLRCRTHNGYEAERYFGRRGSRESSVVRESLAVYSVRKRVYGRIRREDH